MMRLRLRSKTSVADLSISKLLNETTFYPVFLKDLSRCRDELIIECPFITARRTETLLPSLRKLSSRGVRITVNTPSSSRT